MDREGRRGGDFDVDNSWKSPFLRILVKCLDFSEEMSTFVR